MCYLLDFIAEITTFFYNVLLKLLIFLQRNQAQDLYIA
jgi:hypothetical protein